MSKQQKKKGEGWWIVIADGGASDSRIIGSASSYDRALEIAKQDAADYGSTVEDSQYHICQIKSARDVGIQVLETPVAIIVSDKALSKWK